MGVVTKRGDRGMTALLTGAPVRKDDRRIEALGALDELVAFLGLAKALIREDRVRETIAAIQDDLSSACAEVAACAKGGAADPGRRIGRRHVARLEEEIGVLERKTAFRRCGFCVPGENMTAAALDVARVVGRRTERRLVALRMKGACAYPGLIAYLNRLSDLLYLMARWHGTRGGKKR